MPGGICNLRRDLRGKKKEKEKKKSPISGRVVQSEQIGRQPVEVFSDSTELDNVQPGLTSSKVKLQFFSPTKMSVNFTTALCDVITEHR